MHRIIALDENDKLVHDVGLENLKDRSFKWFWVDFDGPEKEEAFLLRSVFGFHPLAIEDCLMRLQRPKLDYYDDHVFFVFHALNQKTLEKEEVTAFLSERFIVTFHHQPSEEVKEVWKRLKHSEQMQDWQPGLILYYLLDKIVDNYFPPLYQMEDLLNELDENSSMETMESLLKRLFDARHDLLTLRHTINPMRDLVYRILNSQRIKAQLTNLEYFSDIHDHLLKLTEMAEANRELTTDIRDSYLSLNSHETNRVMKVLTVITTIFMPLTFIAGVYGMNFAYMPELKWEHGYFFTLGAMTAIGGGMFFWFRKKGWFK